MFKIGSLVTDLFLYECSLSNQNHNDLFQCEQKAVSIIKKIRPYLSILRNIYDRENLNICAAINS